MGWFGDQVSKEDVERLLASIDRALERAVRPTLTYTTAPGSNYELVCQFDVSFRRIEIDVPTPGAGDPPARHDYEFCNGVIEFELQNCSATALGPQHADFRREFNPNVATVTREDVRKVAQAVDKHGLKAAAVEGEAGVSVSRVLATLGLPIDATLKLFASKKQTLTEQDQDSIDAFTEIIWKEDIEPVAIRGHRLKQGYWIDCSSDPTSLEITVEPDAERGALYPNLFTQLTTVFDIVPVSDDHGCAVKVTWRARGRRPVRRAEEAAEPASALPGRKREKRRRKMEEIALEKLLLSAKQDRDIETLRIPARNAPEPGAS
ncbi:MAG: hypothetical protein ACFB2Z_15140 [Maricaulaceae bacterium]